MSRRYLISYDIADEVRLRKVHKVVRAFGAMVQASVYEAILTDTERVKLEKLLRDVMNLKEDQALFIDLGDGGRGGVPEIEAVGLPYRPTERGSVVI